MKNKIEKLNLLREDIVLVTVPRGSNLKAIQGELRKVMGTSQKVLVRHADFELGKLGELLSEDDLLKLIETYPEKFAGALAKREAVLAAKAR